MYVSEVKGLYSLSKFAEIAGMSKPKLNYWVKSGFIDPVSTSENGTIYYFKKEQIEDVPIIEKRIIKNHYNRQEVEGKYTRYDITRLVGIPLKHIIQLENTGLIKGEKNEVDRLLYYDEDTVNRVKEYWKNMQVFYGKPIIF